MRTKLVAALAAVTMVSACGGISSSKLNPFNWGKGSRTDGPATLAPKGGYPTPIDNRLPTVPRVLSLKVSRIPSGVVVEVTGLPPTQGYWESRLVPLNGGEPDDKGVMSYRFAAAPAPAGTPVSTQRSREITAGAFIDNFKLRSVRRIVVEGAQNSLSARR